MNKTAFSKLAVGDEVIVSGEQDGQKFTLEPGVIKEVGRDDVKVRFDSWSSGHGVGEREWNFYNYDARRFTITAVEEPKAAKATPKRPKGAQEYKGNGKHEWENVAEGTQRLRVPGGWLYATEFEDLTSAMTYVPVPAAVGYKV